MTARTRDEFNRDMELERLAGIPYLKRPTTKFYMREVLCRDFLDFFPWQKYMTGTFTEDLETKDMFTCHRRFKRYLKLVKEKFDVNKGFDYFVAYERHQTGYFHIHGLIGGVSGITDSDMWEVWFKKYGRAKVVTYEPGKGATHYLTKYVTKELCGWDIKIRQERYQRLPGA